MRDLFDEPFMEDDFEDVLDVDTVMRVLNNVYQVLRIRDEIKIYDNYYDVYYSLKSEKDLERVSVYENKWAHIIGEVDYENRCSIRIIDQNSLAKRMNENPELILPLETIRALNPLKSYEMNRIFDTIVDCENHCKTKVSRLSYNSLIILTNWLLWKVEENIKEERDMFDDVYLPSGDQMNENTYHFFKENENYRKDSLKVLADFLLYVSMDQVIVPKLELEETYDIFVKRYPESKNEITQILHYLYGLNRNKINIYKNILLKGQNSDHSLKILREMAKILEIPMIELNISSFGDGGDLVGHNPTYSGAMMGRLAENYLRIGATGAIVVFKRLDECSKNTTNHSSIQTIISELLNKRVLNECFLRYDFDISCSFIVGTCLDERNLNADLSSYFYTIEYNEKEMMELKSLIRLEFDLLTKNEDWTNTISEEVIDLIALKTKIDPFGGIYKKYCSILVCYLLNHKIQHQVIDVSFTNEVFNQFFIEDETLHIFTKNYSFYNDEIRKKMSQTIIDLTRNDEKTQKRAKEVILYLQHCHDKISHPIDLKQVQTYLNQTHCGLNHVKDAILNAFCQYNHDPKVASHLMFYSPLCGVGKTSIAINACKAANLDMIRINCAQISSLDALYGNNIHPGLLLSKIKELGTSTAPILLDEFEKCHPTIQNSLLNLTDTSNASFYSPYLETNVPIHCGFMIVTVNDMSQVSDALRDRFKVLEFKPYDINTKKQIIQNKIITSLQQQFSSDLTISNEEIHDYLEIHPFASIREIEMDFRDAYIQALRNQKEVEFEGIVLDCKTTPHTTNALGVVHNQGMISKIECLFDDEKDRLTGNCKELFQEAFEIVLKHMRNKNYLGNEKVFANVYGSGLPKDGGSSGLALFACIYAQKNHLDISNFGFTGEVTLMGNVEKIGGLYFKLMAAKQVGLEKVFIPYDNAGEYLSMQEDLKGLSVYFVRNIEECIQYLRGGIAC